MSSCRRSFGDDLSLIDDGQPVAEAFGLVHVVCGQQDGAAASVETGERSPITAVGSADRVRLSARRETGSLGLPTSAVATASRCFCPPDSLPDHGICFLGQREFLKHRGHGCRVPVETGEQVESFADRQLLRESRLLERDPQQLTQVALVSAATSCQEFRLHPRLARAALRGSRWSWSCLHRSGPATRSTLPVSMARSSPRTASTLPSYVFVSPLQRMALPISRHDTERRPQGR